MHPTSQSATQSDLSDSSKPNIQVCVRKALKVENLVNSGNYPDRGGRGGQEKPIFRERKNKINNNEPAKFPVWIKLDSGESSVTYLV